MQMLPGCPRRASKPDELPAVVREGPSVRTTEPTLPLDGVDFRAAVADYQRRLISEALERTGGVQRKAARLLRLSPTTLNEMVHRLALNGTGDGDAEGRPEVVQ